MATFIQWVDAYALEETELADFYLGRFRPEFKPAVDAWIATRPLRNSEAPLTPFAMPEYRLKAREESDRLEAEAETLTTQARTNVQRATNYVLGVVLFAAALFFAGMSAKLGTPRLRRIMLAFGAIVFVGAVAWLATFPSASVSDGAQTGPRHISRRRRPRGRWAARSGCARSRQRPAPSS